MSSYQKELQIEPASSSGDGNPIEYEPFQRRFLKAVARPNIDTAALSIPRGNGKSFLAGELIRDAMTPGGKLYVQGAESVLMAGSVEQARIAFRFARKELGEKKYRYMDSTARVSINYLPTNTRLRIIGSSGKTAMGLVNCPLVIADEPGAWENSGGQLMHDAIQTAQGKPGSPLKAVYLGTLAPATRGWWHDMIEKGTHGSAYVQALQGRPKKWNHWREIMRVNPLARISPSMQKKLREELEEAKTDTRLKARFLSYRLNLPTADESEVLLTVPDWNRCCQRDVPAREGRPIVAVDLGGGRAWSAALAMYKTGRVEAFALCPGVPSIEAQEKRDRVDRGTYQALIQTGALRVAAGRRVPEVSMLAFAIRSEWGTPASILCDRFRLGELQDALQGACPVHPRMTRWSEAGEDIRALRRLALDGPLAVAEKSRDLLTASLAVARVKNDDQGNVRLVKLGHNSTGRDDVAQCLVLAAGAFERAGRTPPKRLSRIEVVG